eukprot:jgi/Mesvir1/12714/Mv21536-RA.1
MSGKSSPFASSTPRARRWGGKLVFSGDSNASGPMGIPERFALRTGTGNSTGFSDFGWSDNASALSLDGDLESEREYELLLSNLLDEFDQHLYSEIEVSPQELQRQVQEAAEERTRYRRPAAHVPGSAINRPTALHALEWSIASAKAAQPHVRVRGVKHPGMTSSAAAASLNVSNKQSHRGAKKGSGSGASFGLGQHSPLHHAATFSKSQPGPFGAGRRGRHHHPGGSRKGSPRRAASQNPPKQRARGGGGSQTGGIGKLGTAGTLFSDGNNNNAGGWGGLASDCGQQDSPVGSFAPTSWQPQEPPQGSLEPPSQALNSASSTGVFPGTHAGGGDFCSGAGLWERVAADGDGCQLRDEDWGGGAGLAQGSLAVHDWLLLRARDPLSHCQAGVIDNQGRQRAGGVKDEGGEGSGAAQAECDGGKGGYWGGGESWVRSAMGAVQTALTAGGCLGSVMTSMVWAVREADEGEGFQGLGRRVGA